MTISAGKFDRTLYVERNTPAVDDFNAQVPNWNTLFRLFCNKQDLSTLEVYRAAEVGAQLSARFLVRYSPNSKTITPQDRIKCGDEYYEIIGIREKTEQRNRYLEIDVVSRTDKVRLNGSDD